MWQALRINGLKTKNYPPKISFSNIIKKPAPKPLSQKPQRGTTHSKTQQYIEKSHTKTTANGAKLVSGSWCTQQVRTYGFLIRRAMARISACSYARQSALSPQRAILMFIASWIKNSILITACMRSRTSSRISAKCQFSKVFSNGDLFGKIN